MSASTVVCHNECASPATAFDSFRYGALTPNQIAAFRRAVRGRHVHDLGAGDLELARLARTLGAAAVIAVDKGPLFNTDDLDGQDLPTALLNVARAVCEGHGASLSAGVVAGMQMRLGARAVDSFSRLAADKIYCIGETFACYAKRETPVDAVLLSWPAVTIFGAEMDALLLLLRRARTVVLRAKNTDATGCGRPLLYEHLLYRRLLRYVPHERNVLAVYGALRKEPRLPQGDELAGLLSSTHHFSFGDAERASAEISRFTESFDTPARVAALLMQYTWRTDPNDVAVRMLAAVCARARRVP